MALVVTRNIIRDKVVTAGNKINVNITLHHLMLVNGMHKSKIGASIWASDENVPTIPWSALSLNPDNYYDTKQFNPLGHTRPLP